MQSVVNGKALRSTNGKIKHFPSDDTLIATAKKLGISTAGKTRDEILQKANANKPPLAPPVSLKEET